jgi:hypothetical protein
VLEDLKNGYISPETARNQYGLSDEEVERTVREYWFEGPNNL